jgi:hypothetical protein
MRSLALVAVPVAVILAVLGVSAAEESKPPEPSLLHVPIEKRKAEQGILTPIPISVELPRSLAAARVLVHYRVHGSQTFSTLELRRTSGRSFMGEIPCLEVSTITGDVRYYIRVHDREGAVIAFSGSRSNPYVVSVIHESVRPDLGTSPARCPDPSDCPPGLPGCGSEPVELVPCKSDADCELGTSCSWEGFCEYDRRKKNWLSVSVGASAGLFAGAGACSLYSQENRGYSCFRDDGERYLGNPVLTNEPLRVARGGVHATLGFDRLIYYDTTLGARVSYTFFGAAEAGTFASAFVPVAGELRATHFFGHDPFARTGPVFFGFFGAGFRMSDLESTLHVREDPSAPSFQGGNDLEQELSVWKRGGDGFVALGAGVLWKTSDAFAYRFELEAAESLPYSATTFLVSLGADVGF